MKQFWLGAVAATALFGTFHLGKWLAYNEIEAETIEILEPEPQEKLPPIKIPIAAEPYVSPQTMRTELCDTIAEKRRLGDFIQDCLHNGNNADGCLATGAVMNCRNEKLKRKNPRG